MELRHFRAVQSWPRSDLRRFERSFCKNGKRHRTEHGSARPHVHFIAIVNGNESVADSRPSGYHGDMRRGSAMRKVREVRTSLGPRGLMRQSEAKSRSEGPAEMSMCVRMRPAQRRVHSRPAVSGRHNHDGGRRCFGQHNDVFYRTTDHAVRCRCHHFAE